MSSPNPKQRARRLFMTLLDMAEGERTAALTEACGGDAALRAEVEELLRAHREAGSFLSSTPGPTAAPAHDKGESAGASIGRYKLLEQIGEGGMGTIWMAEQREPVKRRVALKIIKLGMDTKQVIARFEAERQALAMMDHPHIAKVLDAGATETGRPYFVMEYIKGIPILEYCDHEKVDTRARLELFASVCQAIQHAHQKGIIHRDIKPSNVLVTLHDGVPVPKVIDFGIAKATNSELTTKTLFTEHRQMVGTPAYMSPEQAELSGLDIDTRSDVYSLGVLLYELLTGTTPFDMSKLMSKGYAEMLRTIREEEPHKPSTRVSTLGDTGTRTAQQRRVDVKRLGTLLRGDLDWIVMKCLEKDRTRRYETANGLASDIQRHLRDEPVTAGPPSTAYRLRKFVKRNRAQVAAAAALFLALLTGVVGTTWGLVQSSRARSAELQSQIDDQQRTAADTARRGRNAEAVGALLGQCEEALRADDAAKARVALDAARKRAAEGGAEADAARLSRLTADLDLLTELDTIEQFRWTYAGDHFGDRGVAASKTRAALRKFGADPDGASVDAATTAVKGSAICTRIVTALDRLLGAADAAGVRSILRQVDPDPFRDAVRDAVFARDGKLLAELASQAPALEQTPGFASCLGESPAIPVERRRQILNAAVLREPANLELLMTLELSLYEAFDRRKSSEKPERKAERARWLQAALATHPGNAAAWSNLGTSRLDIDTNEAIVCYRKAIELDPTLANGHYNLAVVCSERGQTDEAIDGYLTAIELGMRGADVHGRLGDLYRAKGQLDEAMDCYHKAIEVDPKWSRPYACLGYTCRLKGQLDEAVVWLRKSLEIEPNQPVNQGTLGDLHRDLGQVDEALACYRKAIELDPSSVPILTNLSKLLLASGRSEEANALLDRVALKSGVKLNAPSADALVALGTAFHEAGRRAEAMDAFRKAIELDANCALAHHNLGVALIESGKPDDALASYQRAVDINPSLTMTQFSRALILQSKGEHEAALAGFQKTVELDPKHAWAHYNVGVELGQKRQWDEAMESYRRAIELDPTHAEAHCNLASSLQNTGRYAEAVQYFQRGHELSAQRPNWNYPSAQWVRMAEMRAALEAKLPALLDGTVKPSDNAERLEVAIMCQLKDLQHAASRLFAEAFAADPKLTEKPGFLFDSAYSPAHAAAGLGKDAAQLDGRERQRLRKQALEWMRADLTQYVKRLEAGVPDERKTALDALRQWQADPTMACIRDTAALESMPAEDRDAVAKLWAEVAESIAKSQTLTPPAR